MTLLLLISQSSLASARRITTFVVPSTRLSRYSSGRGSLSAVTPGADHESTGRRVASNTVVTLEKNVSNNNQPELDVRPVKGTRDFYPAEMRQRNWLFNHWHAVAAQFAFVEYDAPVLEYEELYIRKAGEEVTQQLYNFVDKGQRRVSLRPEMTPSLARMVLNQKGITMPLKWYSIPQCWRYERMTRGRRREHYQWNMDIWGIESVQAEAELLAAMVQFLQAVGLSAADVGIKINSRRVISELLVQTFNIPMEKFAATCVLIDKLEKVPLDAIQSDLQDLGLDRSVVESLLAVLRSTKSIEDLRVTLGDDSEAVQQLMAFQEYIAAYGIQDWIVFDPTVVRGLSYYTGVVFEAFDRRGQLRAIAGGGRYDQLLQALGGTTATPAVGFGFGDAVIIELLKDRGLLPNFEKPSDFHAVVFAMTPSLNAAAIQIATQLRQVKSASDDQAPWHVDLILEPGRKLKWVLKHAADRVGAQYCFIVGSDEYAQGKVAVKNLLDGSQELVELGKLEDWARREH
jgi:histidyl-tRNA synthetase